MREIFTNCHTLYRCNPFERLLNVPVVQMPSVEADFPPMESNGNSDTRYNVRNEGGGKRRRREYFDFDRPQAKREHMVSFAQDEYTRPSVKYDDL
nr:conserved hypothetical protein [Babesia bovis]